MKNLYINLYVFFPSCCKEMIKKRKRWSLCLLAVVLLLNQQQTVTSGSAVASTSSHKVLTSSSQFSPGGGSYDTDEQWFRWLGPPTALLWLRVMSGMCEETRRHPEVNPLLCSNLWKLQTAGFSSTSSCWKLRRRASEPSSEKELEVSALRFGLDKPAAVCVSVSASHLAADGGVVFGSWLPALCAKFQVTKGEDRGVGYVNIMKSSGRKTLF